MGSSIGCVHSAWQNTFAKAAFVLGIKQLRDYHRIECYLTARIVCSKGIRDELDEDPIPLNSEPRFLLFPLYIGEAWFRRMREFSSYKDSRVSL